MKPSFLFVVLITTIAGSQANGQSELQYQTAVIEVTEDTPLILGRGVRSATSEALGDCIEFGNVSHEGGQLVTQNSSLVTNRNELDTFLQISASMQASSLAGWGASASLEMSHSLTVNTYDVGYVLKVNVLNQGESIKDAHIKDSVLQAILTNPTPVTYFLNTCGDSYVSKFVKGGDLISSLSVSTKSTKESSSASAKLSGSYSLISADTKLSTTVKSLQETSSVKISMSRSGGNGVQLVDSVDELTKLASDFPKQVATAGWKLRAVTQSYATVTNMPDVVRGVLRVAKNDIAEMVLAYNRARDETDRIAYLTSHPDQFFLSDFDIPKLAVEVQALENYKTEIRSQIIHCINDSVCDKPIGPTPIGEIYPARR
jgi:hypothetical protein